MDNRVKFLKVRIHIHDILGEIGPRSDPDEILPGPFRC